MSRNLNHVERFPMEQYHILSWFLFDFIVLGSKMHDQSFIVTS